MFDPPLESLTPGPDLAAAVGGCDLTELSDDEVLEVARSAQRLAAWAESRQLDAVAAFADQRATESVPVGLDLPGGAREPRLISPARS